MWALSPRDFRGLWRLPSANERVPSRSKPRLCLHSLLVRLFLPSQLGQNTWLTNYAQKWAHKVCPIEKQIHDGRTLLIIYFLRSKHFISVLSCFICYWLFHFSLPPVLVLSHLPALSDVWFGLNTVVRKWHFGHDFYFSKRNSAILTSAADVTLWINF